jgi:hypothetical protein
MPIISSYKESEIKSTVVPARLGKKKKIARLHLNRKRCVWWYMPVIPAIWGSIIGLWSRLARTKSETLSPK